MAYVHHVRVEHDALINGDGLVCVCVYVHVLMSWIVRHGSLDPHTFIDHVMYVCFP